MREAIKRFFLNRLQPLGIISSLFLPGLFGINIPYPSAMMVFQTPFLVLGAVANFSFFLILDLRNPQSPTHMRSFWMIYIFFVGLLSIELLPIYTGIMDSIFQFAHAETEKQKIMSELIVGYGFGGSFLFDLFFFYNPKIISKMLSVFVKVRKSKSPIDPLVHKMLTRTI